MVAKYILDYVESNFIKIKDNKVSMLNKEYSFEELKKMFDFKFEELTYKECSKCKKTQKNEKSSWSEYLCNKCGFTHKSEEDKPFRKCPKCNSIMIQTANKIDKNKCSCGSIKFTQKLDLSKVIEVDTILIASRHMYRMPYSLHEKSKLVSIPIKTEEVLEFEKDRAKPENVNLDTIFLNRNVKKGEARELLEKTIASENKIKMRVAIKDKVYQYDKKSFEEYEINQEAVPEEFFPPCINNCRKGLEDGKKRVLFSLVNFLNSLNWSFDKIDDYIHKWNKTNEEGLRENALKSQINYRKKREKILPPNCDTPGYYKDLGLCTPDALCARIKNPVQYAKVKAKMNKKPKRGRKKVVEKKEVKNAQ